MVNDTKQTRANYNQNYVITQTILWWSVNVGIHMAPSICSEFMWLFAGLGAGTALAAAILGLFPGRQFASGILWVVAAVMELYAWVFGYGAEHKGVDVYLSCIPIPA